MTQWVENPYGGRARGPRGLARAWLEVILRPRRFFRTGVAPGDQGPGLTFAVVVTFGYVGTRLVATPAAFPTVDGPLVSSLLVLGVACLLVAPLVLHLAAALQTLLLIPVVRHRQGISETVQVIAYATAPCLLAGVPIPALQVLVTLYGAVLLVVGLAVVHGTTIPRATLAGVLPAMLVFGYAFGGAPALEATTGIALVEPPPD